MVLPIVMFGKFVFQLQFYGAVWGKSLMTVGKPNRMMEMYWRVDFSLIHKHKIV
jgi:hypothetical protein